MRLFQRPLTVDDRVRHDGRIVRIEEGIQLCLVQVLLIAGGGGFGDPLSRDITAVENDVVNGYVSIAKASEDYGVVIDPPTLMADERASQKLRTSMKNQATSPEAAGGEE